MNSQSDLVFFEREVKYKNLEIGYTKNNTLIHLIEREFKDEDELTKKILYECIIENCSLKTFCDQNNLNYANTYYQYRKIRLKLENLLTN